MPRIMPCIMPRIRPCIMPCTCRAHAVHHAVHQAGAVEMERRLWQQRCCTQPPVWQTVDFYLIYSAVQPNITSMMFWLLLIGAVEMVRRLWQIRYCTQLPDWQQTTWMECTVISDKARLTVNAEQLADEDVVIRFHLLP